MTKRVTTEQKNTTGRVGAEVIPIASRPTGEARMTIAAPTWILSGSFKVRGLLCLDGAFANGEPADTLSMGDVLTRIGGVDAATRSASWVWRDDRDGAVVDDSALGDAALVSTSGLRVPLALVPKVIGHGVTREMLTAVGAMAPEGGGSVSSGRAAAYTTKALLGDYLAARTARGRAGATLLYIQKHSKTLLRLLPELARDIGHERLLSYIATRIAEGAGEVIRKELHSVLRPSLKLAYKSDLFGVDPVKVIPEIDNKSVPGERWLTAAEVWGVALYFIDRGAPHRAALTIYAAALGADYAAWSRARHADVRDDLRGARVRGSKRKTRDRLAPTPLPEQKSMLRWAVANADGGPDGALFSAWANARRDLTTACEALGIPSCSPNDLRRTYSTWLAMAGIRNDLIDLALGHAPRTVLEKHYVKRTDDDLLRQMEAEYERHKVRPDEPPSTPSAPRGSNAAPPTPPPAATAARIENPRVGGSIPSLGTRTRGISARYRRAAGVGPPRRTRKYVSAGLLGSAWSRTLLPRVLARPGRRGHLAGGAEGTVFLGPRMTRHRSRPIARPEFLAVALLTSSATASPLLSIRSVGNGGRDFQAHPRRTRPLFLKKLTEDAALIVLLRFSSRPRALRDSVSSELKGLDRRFPRGRVIRRLRHCPSQPRRSKSRNHFVGSTSALRHSGAITSTSAFAAALRNPPGSGSSFTALISSSYRGTSRRSRCRGRSSTGTDAAWQKANDRSTLTSLLGDAAGEDAALRAMQKAASGRGEVYCHLVPAWGRVKLLTEAGDWAGAAAVADDYLRHRDAWTVDPGIDMWSIALDETPFMLKALLRGGKLGIDELRTRRAQWIDAWRARVGPAVARSLWIYGYAVVVDTADDAAEALAALPAYEPLPAYRPSLLADADVGHTLLLGGRVDEALPILRPAAGSCNAFENQFEGVQSSLWLGQALEKKGDAAGACTAYARVLERWGKLGTRSTTAVEAKKRLGALACVK